MNPARRSALKSMGATLAAPLTGCATFSPGAPASLEAQVDEAYEFAFPLFEMARTRFNAVSNPANPMRGQVNRLTHRRGLSDHRARAVTAPNNDTLYSSSWVDLSAGPMVLDIGAMPAGRYWSVALMDFFTNHFALPGSRLDGQGPVRATLVGPRWQGSLPAGRVIRAPGNDVWLLGRWLVDGPADLAQAHAMQDRLQLQALAPAAMPQDAQARIVPRSAVDPENFLAVVNEALGRNPAQAADAALLQRSQAVGLQAGASQVWAQLPEAVRAAWLARIGPANQSLRKLWAPPGGRLNGWQMTPAEVGNFGTAYALRAHVAMSGLAALPTVEAIYPSREHCDDGEPLVGTQRYRIQVPAGGVACDAFWSLSIYERMPDGRLFFTDNPINRYALGNRTPGVQRRADGSMDIWLQRDAPTDPAQRANWLPTPAGPFHLKLRAYLPQVALYEGRSPLPSVHRHLHKPALQPG